MNKIWLVRGKYTKRRFFYTEKSFLDFISNNSKSRYKQELEVFIYDLTEENKSSCNYLDTYLKQKDREEQLSVLLDDNKEVATLQNINALIEEFITKERHVPIHKSYKRSLNEYLGQIKLLGLNFKTFKQIISKSDIRNAFLYYGPSTVEWYQLILSIHNFRFDKTVESNKDKIIDIEERFNNFLEAKKLNKKNHVTS